MSNTPSDAASTATLGTALRSLSDTAEGLEADLAELNRAVDDLQASTERCSETQRSVSASLARAARNLSNNSGQRHRSQGGPTPSTAPADD